MALLSEILKFCIKIRYFAIKFFEKNQIKYIYFLKIFKNFMSKNSIYRF